MTKTEYDNIKLPETLIRTRGSFASHKTEGLIFIAVSKNDGLFRDKDGEEHHYHNVKVYNNSREIMLEIENIL